MFKSVVLIVTAVLAVYGASLKNSFVWDDRMVVEHSSIIKSWNNLPKLFSPEYLTSPKDLTFVAQDNYGSGEASYRPVVTLSYMIDYSLWKLNPFGFHLTNIFLHLINSILVFLLLGMLNLNRRWTLVAALIFAVHPIQVEAVCNINFREDLLAFLFFILAFMNYLKNRRVLSIICFLLAVFSKEMAITLPAVVFLYDYLFRREEAKKIKNYLGYVLAAGFYLFVWAYVFPSRNELLVFAGQTAWSNILTMVKIFGIYTSWLVYPVFVHPTVPDFRIAEFSLSYKVIASLVTLVSVLCLAWKSRSKWSLITFGILWFYLTLLPVANIFPIQNVFAARYLYIPIVGFCLALAFWLQGLKISAQIIKLGVIGFIAVLGLVSFNKTFAYKNGDNFFKELAVYYPEKDWIFRGLGDSCLAKGDLKEAQMYYLTAMQLNPSDVRAYKSLGYIFYKQGNWKEARIEYQKVLELDPTDQEVRSVLEILP